MRGGVPSRLAGPGVCSPNSEVETGLPGGLGVGTSATSSIRAPGLKVGVLVPTRATSSSAVTGISSANRNTFLSTGTVCSPPLTSHDPPGTPKSAIAPVTRAIFEPSPATFTAAPACPAPGMNMVPTLRKDSVKVATPSSFQRWKGSSAFRSMPTRPVTTVEAT